MISALGDNVVLKFKRKERTDGGIFLPDGYTALKNCGEVISKGKTVQDIDCGDFVVYKPYSHVEIQANGQNYLIVDKKDVVCKFSEEPKNE